MCARGLQLADASWYKWQPGANRSTCYCLLLGWVMWNCLSVPRCPPICPRRWEVIQRNCQTGLIYFPIKIKTNQNRKESIDVEPISPTIH